MLSGSPLPLFPDVPLEQLFPHAGPPGLLGVWVRGSYRALHLYETSFGRGHRMLIGPDLGHLLGRCSRIALREDSNLTVLDAEDVIGWRVLQVITATPHLPSLDRLNQIFPGSYPHRSGFQVAIGSRAAEHVLAECLTHGIPVRESRIVYCAEC